MLSDSTLDAIRTTETMESIIKYAQEVYSNDELLSMIFPNKMFVAMIGNLSEGFVARGPFSNIGEAFDDAANISDENVWAMELNL